MVMLCWFTFDSIDYELDSASNDFSPVTKKSKSHVL
jgi:hypothetical protein